MKNDINATLSADKLAGFLRSLVDKREIITILGAAEVRGTGKGYPLQDALCAILGHFKRNAGQVTASRKEAQNRKDQAEAAVSEMNLAERSGELVPAKLVAGLWDDAVTSGSARISKLPNLSKAQKQSVIDALRSVPAPELPKEGAE